MATTSTNAYSTVRHDELCPGPAGLPPGLCGFARTRTRTTSPQVAALNLDSRGFAGLTPPAPCQEITTTTRQATRGGRAKPSRVATTTGPLNASKKPANPQPNDKTTPDLREQPAGLGAGLLCPAGLKPAPQQDALLAPRGRRDARGLVGVARQGGTTVRHDELCQPQNPRSPPQFVSSSSSSAHHPTSTKASNIPPPDTRDPARDPRPRYGTSPAPVPYRTPAPRPARTPPTGPTGPPPAGPRKPPRTSPGHPARPLPARGCA